MDTKGLIDGVAVSEPNVNPEVDRSFTIRQGDGPVITGHSRRLLDYTTALAVYQDCANQAPAHFWLNLAQSISYTYATAHGRAGFVCPRSGGPIYFRDGTRPAGCQG
jgi:hypothetical protein